VNIVAILALIAAAGYLRSLGARPSDPRARRSRRRKAVAFMGALLLIVLALGWPVDGLAERFQWGHMLQHMLLIALAAPLLVLSDPWLRPLHALPRRWRGPTGRILFRDPHTERLRAVGAWLLVPMIAWAAFHAVFIAFHVPALYDLTLHSRIAHDVEHLLFLGLAIGFWVPVIHRERMGTMDRLVYLMAAGFVGSALGLWLVSAGPQYGYPGAGWLSAAADQRLAAGIMGGLGSVEIALIAGVIIYRWLGEDEHVTSRVIVGGKGA
jgi:putative membrane protein